MLLPGYFNVALSLLRCGRAEMDHHRTGEGGATNRRSGCACPRQSPWPFAGEGGSKGALDKFQAVLSVEHVAVDEILLDGRDTWDSFRVNPAFGNVGPA